MQETAITLTCKRRLILASKKLASGPNSKDEPMQCTSPPLIAGLTNGGHSLRQKGHGGSGVITATLCAREDGVLFHPIGFRIRRTQQ